MSEPKKHIEIVCKRESLREIMAQVFEPHPLWIVPQRDGPDRLLLGERMLAESSSPST